MYGSNSTCKQAPMLSASASCGASCVLKTDAHPPDPPPGIPCAPQNDFCLPGSVLCVAGAMGCLPKVVEAVDVARSKGVPIIWVIREHDADGGLPQLGCCLLSCSCFVMRQLCVGWR